MPYKFKPGKMYRMPTHFGPTTGPRQGEGGRKFANVDSPKVTRRSVSFLTVLWENLADPIITGREELGFSKIYCELPEPRVCQGLTHCTASWMGFKFIDMKIRGLRKLTSEEITESLGKRRSYGTLHYKYVPKTGEWGKPEVSYFTLTPSGDSNAVIKEMYRGEGTVQFHEATWEDLPTLFYIVNALHDLEIKEYLGATVVKTVGGKDLSDQRILR